MSAIDNIILIHPTKCAGTTISNKLLKLKGYSKNKRKLYSGYKFNIFFQDNIRLFYFIINSNKKILIPTYIVFYIICLFFTLRNLIHKYKFGLTFSQGSYQHLTYRQLKKTNDIKSNSICITVIRHPQERIVSSYYFLGYHYHYNFIEFLKKIKSGVIISSIPFSGYKAIIKQHIIPMHEYIINNENKSCVDFILRNESLKDDWRKMCYLYNIEYEPLEHINKTRKKNNWRLLYKRYPEAIKLVYDIYEKDFQYFNYKIINN